MEHEKGFTLIEVLASLVIISFILLLFSSVFIQNNKVSIQNTEKLVVVHLADAYLERLRIERERLENVTSSDFIMNENVYKVQLRVSQTAEEERMNLQSVVVTVMTADGMTSATVEGYVVYE